MEGWMVVPIPPGSHFLELRFENTPVRTAGQWLTAASLAVVVGMLIKESKSALLHSFFSGANLQMDNRVDYGGP
jgi:hypothetical protein